MTDIAIAPREPPPWQPDDAMLVAWNEGLRPDPELTVSQWADKYRILSSRAAAEPGAYRTSRTPYLKAIMDDLSAISPVRQVVVKKAAQVGFSEAGMNWLGYIMAEVPGPTLLVQPTVETAKRFSNQRIQPLIEDCPTLYDKVASHKSRDAANTMTVKDFRGGTLVVTGANSAVGLRSMPVRFLMLDEVDAYPADLEGEGDPVALAEARTRTFSYRAKMLIGSTPIMKGMSRISTAFAETDQRYYFVPCPFCRVTQRLEFARLRWQPGRWQTVAYHCIACEQPIREHHKTAMLAAGEWQTTAPSNDPTVHGYHLSALYSPVGWLGWADIAKLWEQAVNDVELRKTFTNTVLGEEWEEEGDAVPDWQRLYDRRETWAHRMVPLRALFLVAGADVQADRIEISVWGWGRGLESWLVEHVVLWGDPGHEPVWAELTKFLGRTWEHETGRQMSLQRLAIDSGGFSQRVYAWARPQARSQVLVVRGVPNYDRVTPVAGPTWIELKQSGRKLKRGVQLWTVSVSTFKREVYKWLTLNRPTDEELAAGTSYPHGYVHLSTAATDEWTKQLVAEQLVVVRTKTGVPARMEWRPLRARNEALDCRNYARAAVWLAGADRWGESAWRQLEQQLELEPPPPPPVAPPPPPALPPPLSASREQPVQAAAAAPTVSTGGNIRFRRLVRRRVFMGG